MENNSMIHSEKWKYAATMKEALPFVWEALQAKVDKMIVQLGDKSPHVAKADGIYDDMWHDWWTSGFWPGMLWIMYDMTGKEH
jgi:unsaturated chondroitin disaccharide hydrolase